MRIILFLILILNVNIILAQEKQDTSKKVNQYGLVIEKVNENAELIRTLKEDLRNNNTVSNFASHVIDFSAFFLAFIAIFLAIIGYIGYRDVREIRSMKNNFNDLLDSFQRELNIEKKNIEKLMNSFEEEKKKSLEVLFPIMEGQLFYYNGNNEKALQSFKEAQKITSSHPILINRINRILVDRGDVSEAISNLELLADKMPNDYKIKYRLAQAYRRNKQLDTAKQIIQQSIELKNDASALYEQGTIEMLTLNYQTAENILIESNRVFTKKKGGPKYWVFTNLAMCQLILGKEKEALRNIEKCKVELNRRISKTPKHPNPYANYGLCLLMEQNEEASNYFSKAIEYQIPYLIAESIKERIEIIENIDWKDFRVEPSLKILKNYLVKIKNNED